MDSYIIAFIAAVKQSTLFAEFHTQSPTYILREQTLRGELGKETEAIRLLEVYHQNDFETCVQGYKKRIYSCRNGTEITRIWVWIWILFYTFKYETKTDSRSVLTFAWLYCIFYFIKCFINYFVYDNYIKSL